MPWVSRILLACLMGLALLGKAAPLRAETAPSYEFVFQADLDRLAERAEGEIDLDDAMLATADIVRARLGDLDGYTIAHLGGGRLAVAMTHADAPRLIRDVFGITGDLDFLLVDADSDWDKVEQGIAPPGSFILQRPDGLGSLAVRKEGGVSGDRLIAADASVDAVTHEPVIVLNFDAKGAQQFAAMTRENIGNSIAIVVDGKLLSAPTINEPILGGAVQISGSFTQESAEQLAIALRSGALPTPFRLIEERFISATP
jgi:preprotein translocase subunit SecD